MGDAGVTDLATHCAELSSVNFMQCMRFTDVAVKALAERCTRLSSVNFEGCRGLTDAALQELTAAKKGKRCPGLAAVNVERCPQITNVAFIALGNQLPKYIMRRDEICSDDDEE